MPNTCRKERQALPAAASLQLNGQSDAACQVVYKTSSTTVSTGSATSPTAGSGRRPAMRQQLKTAIRLTLAAQIRNRLAWILLVAFVPVWYLLIGSMISHAGTVFRLRATGTGIMVDGHDLTLVTAGLSAITLITGFVVFAAVRRSLPFDRRLVLSGYRHSALIAAKTTAALAQAIGIGAYAAAVMLAFWRPAGIWAIAAAD